LYFIDVFIGLLVIQNDYDKHGPSIFKDMEMNYSPSDRPYDIIEMVLLIIVLIQGIAQLAMYTKEEPSKVSIMGF
jgi:hypothetical protein